MVAAAAVAAGSAPQVILGDQPEPSGSPQERLGVACVGVRGRGNSHIGAFTARQDTEVLYVCDVDSEVGGIRAKEVAKRQRREPAFEEDLRKVLDDERVDIVSIATPHHLHAVQAIWAMQAGKDVYLEKPVSHNVSEGRRLVEAARKYGRICQTGTQSRSNPGVIQAMRFVLDGNLGQVRVARGLCYNRRRYKSRPPQGSAGDYRVPNSVNYDLWLGPAPTEELTRKHFHYDWHWQWPYGNGDLGNQGIHQMDLCRWAMGVDQLSQHVLSYGGRFGSEDDRKMANTQVIVHDYGDQSLVFEVRGLKTTAFRGAKIGIIIECTDGYLVMSGYKSGTAFDKRGDKLATFSGGNDKLHFDNFLTAVRSRDHRDLNADVEQGHLSSALCHLGNISYRLGSAVSHHQVSGQLREFPATDNMQETLDRTLAHLRRNGVDPLATSLVLGMPLAFDPSREQFQDHAGADAMLTRLYRHPFIVPPAGAV